MLSESRQFLNRSCALCLFFARGGRWSEDSESVVCTRFNFTIVELLALEKQIEIAVGAPIQITSDQIKLCKAAASKLH